MHIGGDFVVPGALPLPLSMGLLAAEMGMNLQVALGWRRHLLLHASAVAKDGRALIMSGGTLLDGADVFSSPQQQAVAGETLEAMERAYIVRVLKAAGWQIEGERGAARVLGLNPSTLRGRLRKLGIKKL